MAETPKTVPAQHPGFELDGGEAFLDYLKLRQREIAVLVVVVLGGIAAFSGWSRWTESRQRGAQAALGELLEDFENQAREPQAGHDGCLEFASDHRGTQAADHARYLAALWLERAGQAGPAADEMSELADDLGDSSVLEGSVREALARLLEEAGRPAEAAEIYLARIAAAGDDGAPEAVVLAAARTLEAAGRGDEARAVLESFLSTTGADAGPAGGSSSTWARARLAMLAAGE